MPYRRDLRTILYIEDDEGLARLLQKRMERVGYTITLAPDAESGLKHMHETRFDLILLDYYLPGMNGLQLLDRLAPLSEYPPIVILTSSGDESIALAALEKGAADYALKDTNQHYLDLLPAVMQAAYTKDRLARENALQRRELEIAKEKAEAANKAKSEFLTTMSHEIRTPMNVVVGLASLLEETPLNAKQKNMVGTLRANASLLLKLINDLLDLSRIESGQISLLEESFTLSNILCDIEAMFALQAAQKGLTFALHDHTHEQSFIGDATRIQQVLINLVSNAIKFTQEGGVKITAECHLREDDKAAVVVRIEDTGIGIPQDKLEHIFEKFVQADQTITRRYGGSGLGLAISRRLSRLMGGDITAENQGEGTGAVFTVTWQLAVPKEEMMPEATPIAVDPKAIANGKVLVVEDYPANIMVATMMLENLGYEVDTAISGQEALEKVSGTQKPYFAILMDVQMNEMDGYETTRRIRTLEESKGYKQPIIGVTAHALAGDRQRCIESGMDDYMSKPVHPNILAKKLHCFT